MLNKGLDCAVSLTSKAKDIAALGYTFVCRYYLSHSAWRDCLTHSEAVALARAGLWIVSVYEDNPTHVAYFDGVQGRADAYQAAAKAVAAHQPKGTPIYFAYDLDIGPRNWNKSIKDYASTVRDTLKLSGYEVGAYGSKWLIDELKSLGYVKYGWQAMSRGWTGFDPRPDADAIHQGRETTVLGLDVDTDVSAGAGGGWKPLDAF